MIKSAPRMLIAGTGSGCGKTTVVCALLQALKNRGCDIASFKCGPDYIDPMFHSEIIGAQCANIDLFFSDEAQARSLFLKHAAELNIIEGVMGFYDGLDMGGVRASSYHVAQSLNAPVVLVVNARGMALSTAAVVKGFQNLRASNHIQGVIFNHATPMSYPLLKAAVEKECAVRVYGYLPACPECALESRHLGLVTAQEVVSLREKILKLATQAEKSIDLDALMELMRAQPPLEAARFIQPKLGSARIAVARDAAFCFYYRDNLEMLEEMGAELVYFSPLNDASLPNCDGLILGGGYPELYLERLARNESMRQSIQATVQGGLPTIAECGGFMYLTAQIDGYPMAGAISAECVQTGKLCRFGYATISAQEENMLLAAGESICAHEFHYWDANDPGGDLIARKPSGKTWKCAHVTDALYAGYPHLYFPSNTNAAKRFMQKCIDRKMRKEDAI